MKRILVVLMLALWVLAACKKEQEPQPAVPDPVPLTPEEMVLGKWANTEASFVSLIESGDTGMMAYDPGVITLEFDDQGSLVMTWTESEMTIPGTETVGYMLRSDSLLLNDGTAYRISLLTADTLVLDYTETMNGGAWVYGEHLEMIKGQ